MEVSRLGSQDGERSLSPRVYAATLDAETCPACAALAGLEFFRADSGAPVIPNPACTHPLGCRCAWL
jgi:hypothetical protein